MSACQMPWANVTGLVRVDEFLEHLDHADDGAEQAEQRRHRGDGADDLDVAIHARDLAVADFLDGFLDLLARAPETGEAQAGGHDERDARAVLLAQEQRFAGLALDHQAADPIDERAGQHLGALQRPQALEEHRDADDRRHEDRPHERSAVLE